MLRATRYDRNSFVIKCDTIEWTPASPVLCRERYRPQNLLLADAVKLYDTVGITVGVAVATGGKCQMALECDFEIAVLQNDNCLFPGVCGL
jgi:hypothetical protein